MAARFSFRLATALFVALAAVACARAYSLMYDESGIYVVKWQNAPIPVRVKLPTTVNLLDGTSLSGAVLNAAEAWNRELGMMQIAPQAVAPGSYSSGNGINEIVLDSSYDGETFPAGTLAITLGYTSGNARAESDIVFNSAYSWNSYRGPLRSGIEDIHRVALHELGHFLGLDHPDEHGQNQIAIMNSRVSSLDALQYDDRNGGQRLYGVPGSRAWGDAFADAVELVFYGDNTNRNAMTSGATAEPGEPQHGGAYNIRSIWWKWTAPRAGDVTITTMGSDFDTVLGIYTGGAVNALTRITDNDDVDPGVIRTSTVSFHAREGTTYYIALGGWGAEGDAYSYTGFAVLNVTFSATPTLPVFTAHPVDARTSEGGMIAFSAQASGYPNPSYRWQHQAVGGSWVDLPDSGEFDPWRGAVYRTTALVSRAGERFRCLATNSSGTAISNSATLNIVSTTPSATQPLVMWSGPDVSLFTAAPDNAVLQWYRNGVALAGSTAPILSLPAFRLEQAGLYGVTAIVGGTVASPLAVVGLKTTEKVVGAASEVGSNIPHGNGNIYDQVLLQGPAATITANPGQVVRMSFVDLSDDIVQVEFSGAGALSVTLDNATGPARPIKYAQPEVGYWRGHASIVVTGASANTHLSIFSVGRVTAVNQALFPAGMTYDGMADIAFVAIDSSDGKFGGLFLGNTSFVATRGAAGIYAPDIDILGPVYLGDITAEDTGVPMIVVGSAADVRITGGDLFQPNGQGVQVEGVSRLQMSAGTDSHGAAQLAQPLRASLLQDGVDVTQSMTVP